MTRSNCFIPCLECLQVVGGNLLRPFARDLVEWFPFDRCNVGNLALLLWGNRRPLTASDEATCDQKRCEGQFCQSFHAISLFVEPACHSSRR